MDTPDSVLQSGLGLGPGPDTALRSMVDPRDYDRLRYLQMTAAQPNTFEETIHRVSALIQLLCSVGSFVSWKCYLVLVLYFYTFKTISIIIYCLCIVRFILSTTYFILLQYLYTLLN